MRNSRKKKRRCKLQPVSTSVRDLRKALSDKRSKNGLCLRKLGIYQGMSRTYWERCFSIVKVQKYRGILVAVKEYLPRTLSEDVKHEARILTRLCHPYVPCLLVVCVSKKPMRLIMQFEGTVNGIPKVLTLYHLLGGTINPSPVSSILDWMLVCVQIMEAIFIYMKLLVFCTMTLNQTMYLLLEHRLSYSFSRFWQGYHYK